MTRREYLDDVITLDNMPIVLFVDRSHRAESERFGAAVAGQGYTDFVPSHVKTRSEHNESIEKWQERAREIFTHAVRNTLRILT